MFANVNILYLLPFAFLLHCGVVMDRERRRRGRGRGRGEIGREIRERERWSNRKSRCSKVP